MAPSLGKRTRSSDSDTTDTFPVPSRILRCQPRSASNDKHEETYSMTRTKIHSSHHAMDLKMASQWTWMSYVHPSRPSTESLGHRFLCRLLRSSITLPLTVSISTQVILEQADHVQVRIRNLYRTRLLKHRDTEMRSPKKVQLHPDIASCSPASLLHLARLELL